MMLTISSSSETFSVIQLDRMSHWFSPSKFRLSRWFAVRRVQNNLSTKLKSSSYLFMTHSLLILGLLGSFLSS